MNDYKTLSTLTRTFHAQVLEIVKRENARHMMDTHLHYETLALVEEEMIPALEMVLASFEWEPSDEDLLGEPAFTAAEMHETARAQHVAMHN